MLLTQKFLVEKKAIKSKDGDGDRSGDGSNKFVFVCVRGETKNEITQGERKYGLSRCKVEIQNGNKKKREQKKRTEKNWRHVQKTQQTKKERHVTCTGQIYIHKNDEFNRESIS